ncbi:MULTISPECIES: AIPR family protein [Pectobacterium]|uniref:AIPR family protein n=1 Tax=Pectobacterium TaxID=122277 RepID=UPI001F0F3D2B|nr:AIPR family protein [Pectobacterium aquaticum]MCH5050817.1 AIPR family protein [Pectobacterium aquaticum]
MTIVTDIPQSANSVPASATAGVQARRIGQKLLERFESHIDSRECAVGSSQYTEKMTSRAIAAFAIQCYGATDDIEASNAVCDSSNDGGIDAIFVSHVEKKLICVQAKYNQSGNSTWSLTDFLRFKEACSYLQREEYHRFDERVSAKSQDITIALDSIDYKFYFIMAHTGKVGAASQILTDMQTWQSELNDDACVNTGSMSSSDYPFQVHLFSAEDISSAIQGQSLSAINLEDVELMEYGKIIEPHNAYFGAVTGEQISEWWSTHGTQLFSKNIRNILGQTDVNDSIKKTVLDEPNNFWFYNNGITVLVREANPHRRNTSDNARGLFTFHDISIINGAQTVSSIGLIAKQNNLSEDYLRGIRLQARFIVTDDNDLVKNITRANNHQNRVLGRDFASQEYEQVRLNKDLIVEGYTYQLLRTNEIQGATDKVITIDEALNALVCANGTPSAVVTLKSQRGKFFENLDGSLYRSAFNSTVSGVSVINAVNFNKIIDRKIHEKLSSINRQRDKKLYGILTHGNRYISAMMFKLNSSWRERTISVYNDENIQLKFNSLTSSTENYLTQNHDGAYLARLFTNVEKTTSTMRYIQNLLSQQEE